MRSVYLWKCSCGTSFKAVCNIEKSFAEIPPVILRCHVCKEKMELEGEIQELWAEEYQGMWKTVGRSS